MEIFIGKVEYDNGEISNVSLESLGGGEYKSYNASIESDRLKDVVDEHGYFSVELKDDVVKIVPPWNRKLSKEESDSITKELNAIFGDIDDSIFEDE